MSLLSQLFGGGGGSPLAFPSEDYIVGDLLLVGGGGGTSTPTSPTKGGGGGGAGRVVTVDNVILKVGDTGRITVGAGATGESATGYLGESSYFYLGENAQSLHTIVAAGGGASTDNANGYNGGCGGGGGASPAPSNRIAGIATDRNFLTNFNITQSLIRFNTIQSFSDGPVVRTVFASSGSPGGDSTITEKGGGGGGAGRDDNTARTPTNPDGSIGQGSSPTPVNSLGGAGYVSSITGVAVTYGQGGDGGTLTNSKPAVPIPPNTGSGGHGGLAPTPAEFPQGFGSDGVFVIRWPTSYPQATSVTGNDGTLPVNAVPGYYTYRWITPGTITY